MNNIQLDQKINRICAPDLQDVPSERYQPLIVSDSNKAMTALRGLVDQAGQYRSALLYAPDYDVFRAYFKALCAYHLIHDEEFRHGIYNIVHLRRMHDEGFLKTECPYGHDITRRLHWTRHFDSVDVIAVNLHENLLQRKDDTSIMQELFAMLSGSGKCLWVISPNKKGEARWITEPVVKKKIQTLTLVELPTAMDSPPSPE